LPKLGEEKTWVDYDKAFPSSSVQVARKLMEELTLYVDSRHLEWKQFFRKHWLGYVRPGGPWYGYYVAVINLQYDKAAEFAIKLPVSPELFQLHGPGWLDPYPALDSWWDADHKQWTWIVPSASSIGDVSKAVDIAREYQPDTGPMRRPGWLSLELWRGQGNKS
jgi:hypothetical protein